jgi:hypothetical protein
MIRKVHADKANRTVTLEMTESDVSNIIDSIDNMVDKQQRTLLENLPAEDRLRSKLDSYKALREDLRKVLEGIV